MSDSSAPIPSRLVVVADDLSGAVETAALLVAPDGTAPRVVVTPDDHSIRDALALPGPLAINADIRTSAAAAATARLARLFSALSPEGSVFVKIDSILRGPLSRVVEATSDRAPTICTAVPAVGRTVAGGVVHVAGIPLHRTDLWRTEPAAAPTSVGAALGQAAGLVAIADAETDADLANVVRGAHGALIGAAGLARAWAARHGHHSVPTLTTDKAGAATAISLLGSRRPDPLCIVGSASAQSAAQVLACENSGVVVERPSASAIGQAEPATGQPAVVAAPTGPGCSDEIDAGFAALARRVGGDRDLVVAGGTTAMAVLTALGIAELTPIAEVHPGAVVSRGSAPDGSHRLIVTRPGSYGDNSSLLASISALTAESQERP